MNVTALDTTAPPRPGQPRAAAPLDGFEKLVGAEPSAATRDRRQADPLGGGRETARDARRADLRRDRAEGPRAPAEPPGSEDPAPSPNQAGERRTTAAEAEPDQADPTGEKVPAEEKTDPEPAPAAEARVLGFTVADAAPQPLAAPALAPAASAVQPSADQAIPLPFGSEGTLALQSAAAMRAAFGHVEAGKHLAVAASLAEAGPLLRTAPPAPDAHEAGTAPGAADGPAIAEELPALEQPRAKGLPADLGSEPRQADAALAEERAGPPPLTDIAAQDPTSAPSGQTTPAPDQAVRPPPSLSTVPGALSVPPPPAAPVPALPAAPAPAAPPLLQVAAAIQSRGPDETRIEIRLDPPELGRVEVRLEVGTGGETRAHLTVERKDTLDMFLRDQRGLERALDAAGLRTGDGGLQFSLRDDGRRGGPLPMFGDARQDAPQPPAEATLPVGYDRVTLRLRPGGVDLRI